MNEIIRLHIFPRVSWTWDEFVAKTPKNSIALDGMVKGGPRFDEETRHINFDHHDGVIREATMSTAMQVFMAIKGGLMQSFRENGHPSANVYINDTDQDTTLAVWLLGKYHLFEGTQSYPLISRLLFLEDKWDITGGAFPISLSDNLVCQHAWIFYPYTCLRKSGKLASADENVLRDNIEASIKRLDDYFIGKAGEEEIDIRHEILYDSANFKIIKEIGGDARQFLFGKGLNAFISLVTVREDGRFVWSIGRRSKFIPFPVPQLYIDFNEAEGLTALNGWGGSDIVGGSSREFGSKLMWEKLAEITEKRLKIIM
ncbi:MAG: hypothetical protein WAV31_01270 [Candidatus Moraniibacteriota bacterium]